MSMMEETDDLWEFLEIENPKVQKTKDLFEWGLNWDVRDMNSPFLLFIDIIGWSEDHMGERLYQGGSLGPKESHLLAEALNEWADDPQTIRAWIDQAMTF